MKSAKKNKITIRWKSAGRGTSYTVYGNTCGKGKRVKKLTTVTGTSFTQKGLKKGTYYKYIVVAAKNGTVLSTSKVMHIATAGGRVTNPKKLKVEKKTIKLKKKKSAKIKVTTVKQNTSLKIKKHRKLVFESSNPSVATVSRKGKVKGLKKGSVVITIYAKNGISAKVKVKVR